MLPSLQCISFLTFLPPVLLTPSFPLLHVHLQGQDPSLQPRLPSFSFHVRPCFHPSKCHRLPYSPYGIPAFTGQGSLAYLVLLLLVSQQPVLPTATSHKGDSLSHAAASRFPSPERSLLACRGLLSCCHQPDFLCPTGNTGLSALPAAPQPLSSCEACWPPCLVHKPHPPFLPGRTARLSIPGLVPFSLHLGIAM